MKCVFCKEKLTPTLVAILDHYESKHLIQKTNPVLLSYIERSQLNDMVYYFENGLMSLPHNHPDLEPIINYRSGKRIEDLFEREIERKTLKIEDEIVLKTKHLRYYSSIMDHVLESGVTVKNHILSQL